MFAKGTEINTTVVVKKLNEILQARGKKGTDRYNSFDNICICSVPKLAPSHFSLALCRSEIQADGNKMVLVLPKARQSFSLSLI